MRAYPNQLWALEYLALRSLARYPERSVRAFSGEHPGDRDQGEYGSDKFAEADQISEANTDYSAGFVDPARNALRVPIHSPNVH
jgi:hypothetical protein